MPANNGFQLLGLTTLFVPSQPGVYLLSRDGIYVHYVGRSDSDLSNRIRSSARDGYGYKYFWYTTSSSAAAAYRLECELFHKYSPPDNQIHPDAPAGSYLRCPQPGCPQALGALAQLFYAAARRAQQ